tara:strand:+ start:1474 stop:1788 length:315 start_codon:yes stop_codon:yes gene_type:complete
MLADPDSYIFDNDHGEWMGKYKQLVEHHQGPDSTERGNPTGNERKPGNRKRSIIRDVANQSQWASNPPNEDEIREMRMLLKDGDESGPMSWDDLIEEIDEILED